MFVHKPPKWKEAIAQRHETVQHLIGFELTLMIFKVMHTESNEKLNIHA
jgi:hypothetical protein